MRHGLQFKQEQLRLEGEAREHECAAAMQEKNSSGQGTAPDTCEQLLKPGQLRDDDTPSAEAFQQLKKKVLC